MGFCWNPRKPQENILINLRAAIITAALALSCEFQPGAAVFLEELHGK